MPSKKKTIEVPEDAYLDFPMEAVDFLYESNLIENERSMDALEDALQAWKYALSDKASLQDHPGVGRSYIQGIHHWLMHRLRPDIAGNLRDCDVWIGGKLKMFVSHTLLKEQVEDWVKETKVLPKHLKMPIEQREDLVKKWHIMFESIHPFEDGNGRTGRILWQIQRQALGLPVLVLNAFEKREKYYPWFQGKE